MTTRLKLEDLRVEDLTGKRKDYLIRTDTNYLEILQ